mmetsp:Transcript_25909/g.39772  ORF Transcript_25909/g.39772 Transcript_25909/m.39772 type:complete len:248 (-) Transcript_25909:95-838(-)
MEKLLSAVIGQVPRLTRVVIHPPAITILVKHGDAEVHGGGSVSRLRLGNMGSIGHASLERLASGIAGLLSTFSSLTLTLGLLRLALLGIATGIALLLIIPQVLPVLNAPRVAHVIHDQRTVESSSVHIGNRSITVVSRSSPENLPIILRNIRSIRVNSSEVVGTIVIGADLGGHLLMHAIRGHGHGTTTFFLSMKLHRVPTITIEVHSLKSNTGIVTHVHYRFGHGRATLAFGSLMRHSTCRKGRKQ